MTIRTLGLAAAAVVATAATATARCVSILHTGDVHGYVDAQNERANATLDATLADYAALLERHATFAAARKCAPLAFDSGDWADGTGLSDATRVKGQLIYDFVTQLPRGAPFVTTAGNHDLGRDATVTYMAAHFAPRMRNRFVTTNTFYYNESAPPAPPQACPSAAERPLRRLGAPYAVVDASGVRVFVIGLMYVFTNGAANACQVPPVDAVRDAALQNALRNARPDLIAVVAHIDPEAGAHTLRDVALALKTLVGSSTPVAFFTGHRHRLVFVPPGDASLGGAPDVFAIESGKYLQAVGAVLISDVDNVNADTVKHTWLPANVEAFAMAVRFDGTLSQWRTPSAIALQQNIDAATARLGLNRTLGCVPRTYLRRADVTEPNSLYALLFRDIAPHYLYAPARREHTVLVTNQAAYRTDLYAGKFRVNDLYQLSPFNSTYRAVSGVPGTLMQPLIDRLLTPTPGFTPSLVAPVDVAPRERYDVVATTYDSRYIERLLAEISGDGGRWRAADYAAGVNPTDTLMTKAYVESLRCL